MPLLRKKRYKGAHGGRGSAKSHFFAEQLIVRCAAELTRAVCIREVQNSLKESVRQLLIDKIVKLGLFGFFDILEGEIRGRNGSLIIFKGMQSFNADNIKSLEGFDIAWVEEAQTFSSASLRMLRPTLRKETSELWFSWNPRYDSDAVDAFFRSGEPHPDAVVVAVNGSDNPWFPEVLRKERAHDYATDPEMAEHVWEGGYEIVTEGSYYAKLIAHAEKEGRIGHFPHDPKLPVLTSWDIGVDDYTAVCFWQTDGITATVLDYYEASGEGAEPVVRECMPELMPNPSATRAKLIEIERETAFRYDRHYLPHDVKVREWGGGGKERRTTLNELGVKPINVGVAYGPEERINASRQLIPLVRFNNTRRVQVLVSRLRRYSRKFNETMKVYTTPLHDINSHGADAFGEFAVNCGLSRYKPKPPAEVAPKPGFSRVNRSDAHSMKVY